MSNPRETTMGSGQEALRHELAKLRSAVDQALEQNRQLAGENERLRALYRAVLARNIVLNRKGGGDG